MPFDNPQPPSRYASLLRDVRAQIDDPTQWAQGFYVSGRRVCLVRAVTIACGSCDSLIWSQVLRLLSKQLPFPWRLIPLTAAVKLIAYNDWSKTTHTAVIDLIDRAITHAEFTEPCYV